MSYLAENCKPILILENDPVLALFSKLLAQFDRISVKCRQLNWTKGILSSADCLPRVKASKLLRVTDMTVHHSLKTAFGSRFVTSCLLLAKALVLTPVALGLPAPARSTVPLFEVRIEAPSHRPNLFSNQPCTSAGTLTADDSAQAVAELPPPPPAGESTVDLLPVPNESMSAAAQPLANGQCPIGGPTDPAPDSLIPGQLTIQVMPENPACSRPGQVVLLCGPL